MSNQSPSGKPPQPGRSKRDGMMDKAVQESVKAREREEKMRELRAIFSNYGHHIMSHVTSQFIRYGHLKNTLKLLGLNQPSDFGAQRDLLLRHLDQNGTRGLLQKLSGQETPSQAADLEQAAGAAAAAVPPPQPAEELPDALAEQILDEAESRLMERVLQSRRKKNPRTINEDDTHTPNPKASDATATDYNSPRHRKDAAGHDDAITICPKTGRPMRDGAYIERRSGGDRRLDGKRRHSKDRRESVELIYQNKRYGQNRRTNKDRRSGQDRRNNP